MDAANRLDISGHSTSSKHVPVDAIRKASYEVTAKAQGK